MSFRDKQNIILILNVVCRAKVVKPSENSETLLKKVSAAYYEVKKENSRFARKVKGGKHEDSNN